MCVIKKKFKIIIYIDKPKKRIDVAILIHNKRFDNLKKRKHKNLLKKKKRKVVDLDDVPKSSTDFDKQKIQNVRA